MSYDTRVEFLFVDELPPFELVQACAREHFDARRYGVEDIIASLGRGWDQGAAEFNRMEVSDFEGFMLRLSQRMPGCRMCVRGSGEEWRDFWLREFEGGKVAFAAGPFIEGKKPTFFRSFFGKKDV